MRKTRITSLLLAVMILLCTLTVCVSAKNENVVVSWKGAMNYNNENNYVTAASSVTAPNMTELKWAYGLNTTEISGGAYYAGQTVIVDGYLYATGGGKLHRVSIENGEGAVINENAGTTESFYDYLCYADGVLILSTSDELFAYSLDGEVLGSVSGSFGDYHPVQYYNGYVICNGFIFKTEIIDDVVSFIGIGDTAIGDDTFNWSSGAFVNDVFYVAGVTTVYAVDIETNTVLDSFVFDANRTSTKNVQGGLCYDKASGRLFWATYTYNSFLHSIKLSENGFDKDSYMSEDVGQKSVATPICYNGRVYLAGQQGRICVHNTGDLSKVYDYVTLGGGKVQGTPILSSANDTVHIYAQCSNGHMYLFTDSGESGSAVKLCETGNPTKVLYPYAGYEQYAMDENGNIYCYNESGYLFCFGRSDCEMPAITKDLSTSRVKYGVGAQTDVLCVEAEVSSGSLSYLWQKSTDGDTFVDIDGITESSFNPPTEIAGTTYYRCVITNTDGEFTASKVSSAAHILVKELSGDTTLIVKVGKSNSVSATSDIADGISGDDGVLYVENCTFDVKNIFLGVADEGSVSDVSVLYGAGTAEPKKYSVSDNVYPVRYYKNTYSKPIVAKITVLAEDGVTESEKYLVVSQGEAGAYITEAKISSESEYLSNGTITFTAENQTAELAIEAVETVGVGDLYNPQWEWTSSDAKVATVDENGVVKCVGGGSAVITASHQGVSVSVNVAAGASEHKLHTYADGKCIVCNHGEPSEADVFFTLIDESNKAAVSADGSTEIYRKGISVGDIDLDGTVTVNDAFKKVHILFSENGNDDFVAEESTYGLFITKLWGVETSNISYMLNDASVYSLTTPINENDVITAYFYRDTVGYSDIYSYISGNDRIVAGIETEFKLQGVTSSGNVVPKGASIKVIDENGVTVNTAVVDENGKFTVLLEKDGEYTLEAGGNGTYVGSAWDYAIGGYVEKEFDNAPVVMSRLEIEVLPYVEKNVYITIATKNGKFATGKNGEDMWHFSFKATDDYTNPDGAVTISEMLTKVHADYHADGTDAFYVEKSKYGDYITKLWGENNGGNCLYYFNNVEMNGYGTKTGYGGREWEDKLLDTVLEDGDIFTIYSLQATDYKKSDLFTYFDNAEESVKSGKETTFTLKSVAGYGNNTVENSVVTVYDKNGEVQEKLSTVVGADGTFKIKFPKKGKYTVDVTTGGANYICPARFIANVSKGGSSSSSEASTITVYFTLLGDKKHGESGDVHTYKKENLEEWIPKTKITVEKGSTAFDVIAMMLTQNNISYNIEDGYISEIGGLSEFDNGDTSGWMYSVNGKYPTVTSAEKVLSKGDKIILHFTDDYTVERSKTNSGSSSGGFADSDDTQAEDVPSEDVTTDKNEDNTKNEESEAEKLPEFTEETYTDITPDDWYYSAAEYTYNKGLITGTENGFEPDALMTRAMLVTVLWRMEGSPESTDGASFSDVAEDLWYAEAVKWAKEKEIVNGMSESEFGTDNPITREQAITVIFRYIGYKDIIPEYKRGMGISDFSDGANISEYATDALEWAVDNSVIKGMDNNSICPESTLTRAQTAVILMRLCTEILK